MKLFVALLIFISQVPLMTSGQGLEQNGKEKSSHLTSSVVAPVNKIKDTEDSKLITLDQNKKIYSLKNDHPQFENLYKKLVESQNNKKPVSLTIDSELNVLDIK